MTMSKSENNVHFQRYNIISAEVKRLLELSEKNFEGQSFREVKCPHCGTCVGRVGVNNTGFIYSRCTKCKHEHVLDLRYFRTARIRKSEVKVKPLPEFMPGLINLLRQDLF